MHLCGNHNVLEPFPAPSAVPCFLLRVCSRGKQGLQACPMQIFLPFVVLMAVFHHLSQEAYGWALLRCRSSFPAAETAWKCRVAFQTLPSCLFAVHQPRLMEPPEQQNCCRAVCDWVHGSKWKAGCAVQQLSHVLSLCFLVRSPPFLLAPSLVGSPGLCRWEWVDGGLDCVLVPPHLDSYYRLHSLPQNIFRGGK